MQQKTIDDWNGYIRGAIEGRILAGVCSQANRNSRMSALLYCIETYLSFLVDSRA